VLKNNNKRSGLQRIGVQWGSADDHYERDMQGIATLADALKDMGALLVLSLKSNNLRAHGGKALAAGLKGNQVITELNIADNNLTNYGEDMSGFIALADVIPDMRALSSLNLSKNALLTKEAGKVLGDMLKGNSILKELDVSSNYSINASATLHQILRKAPKKRHQNDKGT
jgi:hypothetical protein